MFEVGDIVTVTSGLYDSPVNYNSKMESFIGKEVTIATRRKGRLYNVYEIEEDNRRWYWSDCCFSKESENEIPVSDEEFSDIVSFLCSSSTRHDTSS